ncbi:MAG TPA: sugar-binding protein [Planctomycetota bacterium]|nr:sugar-binding protein [Planctomycetota bacterium]
MRAHRTLSVARCLLVAVAAWRACAAAQPDTQTKRTDWCEVSAPKTIKVGERVELRVKLTAVEGKVWVSCDLKTQDHRMVRWGGPPKPAAKGQELVWSLPVADVPNLVSLYALLYATRNEKDDWQKALAQTSSPPIAVAGRSPLVDLTYKKSWLWVDASNGGKPLVSGDTWEVPVEYCLDPADHWQKTTLTIWGTGPWIDVPDGKYTTKRQHIGYPGLSATLELTQPGRGRHVFTFKVPQDLDLVRTNNRVLLIAGFRDATGQAWPWHHRANNSFVRRRGFFEIETDVPGHLFTYEEPVRIALRLKNAGQPGEKKTLRYRVHDTAGAVAAEGQRDFTAEKEGQKVWLDLDLKRRGVFLLEAEVPGWETRRTTFARIPDLKAIARGRPTRFGMTNHWDAPSEEAWAIAQRLGLSTCRRFTPWYRLQPGPDVYKLDELERELEAAAKYGVSEWLCIVDPPPFAFAGKPEVVGYRAFHFEEGVWRDFVTAATTRLKGKFLGWEWLNEITPGGCEDPVGTYVKMCRLGTEAAKAVDPTLVTILAGGLFPRAFRSAVLTAGVGKWIDVLPVHYQNGDGIAEARQDLDAAGLKHVAVWEDESAKGLNAWAVPPLEELQNTAQCAWVLRQWTDELAAGCEKLIYFGGKGDAAGNFGYLLDDLGPRPVAATLAVLTSKLFGAKPLGVFTLGKGGLLHLFEREGKPVLVAATYEPGGEAVPLCVGTERVVLTDYQGNEATLSAPGGKAELRLSELPLFVEGGDLDTLKAYVVPEVHVARVAAGTSASVARARRIAPRVSAVRGLGASLAVRLRNLYGRPLSGTVRVELPEGWPAREPLAFSLAKGQDEVRPILLSVPSNAEPRDYPVRLTFTLDDKKLPPVEKSVVLCILTPDMLGNLMPNGDFETPDAAGTGPEGFGVNGQTKLWAKAEGLHDGLGQHVLRFQGSANWEHCGRTIPLRGGQTYLYSMWVRNERMQAGSNMTQHLADGREVRLYDVQVIACGNDNPFWQLFTCRKEMPPDTQRVSFTPVVKGPGWAAFDNLRVTLFEGSDYAAEARRAKSAPKIDGKLDDWDKTCPVPLIGRNQLTIRADGYAWSPDDLSAIAYVTWDDANLYLALHVRDNVHHAAGSGQPLGAAFLQGDSVVLGIDPTKRGPDADSKAFAYYIASTVPGGGSGKHTLFRPQQHSGGRTPGHLFRDSSIYDLAVTPGSGACVYELRIPLAELGVQGAVGTKIGLSLQLNDSDGKGPVAQMNWGGGLHPNWYPRGFGIVTLVE